MTGAAGSDMAVELQKRWEPVEGTQQQKCWLKSWMLYMVVGVGFAILIAAFVMR